VVSTDPFESVSVRSSALIEIAERSSISTDTLYADMMLRFVKYDAGKSAEKLE
jgi:hypothetical protein